MAAQISYPGVYVEELPNGSNTIIGVPTAITAFIGRAQHGPVDEPITVFSLQQFQYNFGSDTVDYPMPAAVHHFFLNGGSEAIIIRRVVTSDLKTTSGTSQSSSARAQLIVEGIELHAANPGSWGNELSVEINKKGITDQVAAIIEGTAMSQGTISQRTISPAQKSVTKDDLFNLTVLYQGKPVESFTGVTLKGDERSTIHLESVLKLQSSHLQVVGNLPKVTPNDIVSTKFIGGMESDLLSSIEDYLGDQLAQTGIHALNKVDIFNLLCIPADQDTSDECLIAINPIAAGFCEQKRAIYIAEPLSDWSHKAKKGQWSDIQVTDIGITGNISRFACTYFPKVMMSPISKISNGLSKDAVFSNTGVIAGVMANNDMTRGVWAASAGQNAVMMGVTGLALQMDDTSNGVLNSLGINCLRDFPIIGAVVWGDRTLRGADILADDFKYLHVRRLANYIELSLQSGIAWAAFEKNDEVLWSLLRLSINDFMQDLAAQGAFYNFKVSCDATTTTVQDIMKGIVNVAVSFAPNNPDEFITIELQQVTG
jgi:phage tail sheath protein FI